MDTKKFEEELLSTPRQAEAHQGDQINGMLKAEIVSCDYKTMSVEMKFPVQKWQLNRVGKLHGGIIVTMFDYCFGALTRATSDLNFTPTIEITTTFLKPIESTDTLIIKASASYKGRRITHLQGDMIIENSNKKAAMGRGIFLNEDTSKPKSKF